MCAAPRAVAASPRGAARPRAMQLVTPPPPSGGAAPAHAQVSPRRHGCPGICFYMRIPSRPAVAPGGRERGRRAAGARAMRRTWAGPQRLPAPRAAAPRASLVDGHQFEFDERQVVVLLRGSVRHPGRRRSAVAHAAGMQPGPRCGTRHAPAQRGSSPGAGARGSPGRRCAAAHTQVDAPTTRRAPAVPHLCLKALLVRRLDLAAAIHHQPHGAAVHVHLGARQLQERARLDQLGCTARGGEGARARAGVRGRLRGAEAAPSAHEPNASGTRGRGVLRARRAAACMGSCGHRLLAPHPARSWR